MPTPVHHWIVPRLDALIADGVKNGMNREVLVAVLIDIIQGPGYNDAVVREEDAPPPSELTDPTQEPVPTTVLPLSRPEWFPYSPSSLPDPEQ
jgi:hypothetical protein